MTRWIAGINKAGKGDGRIRSADRLRHDRPSGAVKIRRRNRFALLLRWFVRQSDVGRWGQATRRREQESGMPAVHKRPSPPSTGRGIVDDGALRALPPPPVFEARDNSSLVNRRARFTGVRFEISCPCRENRVPRRLAFPFHLRI